MPSLTSQGEVASFNQADQFQPGKSAYECGFFTIEICRSMAPNGHSPTLSSQQIINEAEAAYARYEGGNQASNMRGMTNDQLYNRLHDVGLHYQAIENDLNLIRAWLAAGYPVVISVEESHVHDLQLGDRVPYPWTPAGLHLLTLTGLDGQNVLVRDSANIAPPNNLRQGPRHYDANILGAGLYSSTVVVPPWMARPSSTYPPTPTLQPRERTGPMIPNNWKDENNELIAPNGHKVTDGFRQHVLNANWDKDNEPLEEAYGTNPVILHGANFGAGTRQLFRDCLLWWTGKEGVVQEGQMGAELDVAYKDLAQLPQQQAHVTQLEEEIKTLQAQLAATPHSTVSDAHLQALVQHVSAVITSLNAAIATLSEPV